VYVAAHFIYMQGLGSIENATAELLTPRFDYPYRCFRFAYHMWGDSGMGMLQIYADVGGVDQPIWSQSGERKLSMFKFICIYVCVYGCNHIYKILTSLMQTAYIVIILIQ